MTYRRIKDVSILPHDLVCRESRLARATATLIGLGLVALVLWLPPLRGRWYGWILAGFAGIFPFVFGGMLFRAFGPQNWILRITARGQIMIKFRSFANAHFSQDDEAIIEFSSKEIAWVGQQREKLLSPTSDGDGGIQQQNITYLAIGMKDVDTVELSRRLADERRREAPGKHVRTKTHDYPVRLVDGGSTLQICWRGMSNRIVPPLKKVLPELSRFAPLQEPRRTVVDLVSPPADAAAQEAQILDLTERGDRIGAIKLARKRYGYSMAEARNFVEELCSSGDHGGRTRTGNKPAA